MPELIRQMWLTSPMMRGDDVMALQQMLRAQGAAIDVDGIFGRATREAVIGYQNAMHLSADGVVGAATWHSLFPPAAGAATGVPSLPTMQASSILTAEVLAAHAQLHGRYGGSCRWALGKAGVTIEGDAKPAPTASEIRMVGDVLRSFAQPLATVLSRQKTQVPIELVVACICTESGGRPAARRLEPGCDTVDPERTPSRVSVGLMQTLLSTARSATANPALRLMELENPEVSIRAGAAYMFMQAQQTKFDPPLSAAAYNAGGVYFEGSAANRWRLRQFPIGTAAHVDRFVRFFNAALGQLDLGSLPAEVPAFKRVL